ncbi:nebulin-related-anchoring protein isoform X1 [Latimeria chalumnae]|uniref:nebulin-related-anchoring protein isoform X1 n=1 Tax=Latimeria chalumnae TaxID=7897 RepID=UPI0003C190B4|nr:PREDICTED: nebulin-related-anchoring protein isoform X1 [Latimeria chalumnae]|eukprot:XP_006002862.1 PREDICTED: nebulin-related-anchoring protein isoform X1 [Latimeria chalumnae]
MNAQPCARCSYGVYPAEKVNCIGQIWHKSCFHCEVCKMILTVNNFVSHEKKPYCKAHNPKNNTFTSILETPVNIHTKKQTEAFSEIKYREEGEKFKSVFHLDVKSREAEHAYKIEQFASQEAYQAAYEEEKSWHSANVTNPELIRASQAQKTISDVKYTGEYEQHKGKGSFPATITPAYQIAKKANELASDVKYKQGHEKQVSKYTSVADTPEILHAKSGGQLVSDLRHTEAFEQQRGKGSFPAMITPSYHVAQKANELASNIKYRQHYEREIKGKASQMSKSEVALGYKDAGTFNQHEYTEDYEQVRGKGSFPAMITPAYQIAKRANDLASDIKYKQDLSKMKGAAHFHCLTTEDSLVMRQAQNVNKLVSEVQYKKDLENSKGHSINYCETPQFKNMAKISKYTSDLKYKEKYQDQMKGHYEGVGMDRSTLHAMKVKNLASNLTYKADYEHDKVDYYYPATLTPSYETTKKLVPLKDVNYRQHIDKQKYSVVTSTPQIVQAKINAQQLSDLNYRAQYEKTKTQYTLPQDTPQIVKAKANAELYSENKYREDWKNTKGKTFDSRMDSMSMLTAKASGDLASNLKYKEAYLKTKDKAIGTNVSDSKLLHSLRVAKMNSERAYKRGFEETKTQFHLPMDMVNLTHAKKAQTLASDLGYKKKLHEYTVLPDDMKVQWAKKAYDLQSENQYRADLTWMKGVGWMTEGSINMQQAKKAGDIISEKKYRQKADALKFTSVADSPQIKHAKKSQDLQSDLMYKSGTEQILHQYTISKEEPQFRQAKANAQLLSEKMYKSSWEKQKQKGFELRLDALSILTAKAKRDLASDIKYKEGYERAKGKLIGVKGVQDDSQIAHSLQVSKLQSDLEYKKGFKDTKSKYHISMDMMDLVHAKMAQGLATDTGYKKLLHHYTVLPSDMKLNWAKKVYNMQSDLLYKSDLNWMRGVGWLTAGSLDVEQAKKAGEMISETRYRQHPCALKFTSIKDTPEMIQARISYNQAVDRLYREQGENMKHQYTLTKDLPEVLQAKMNARNISEIRYKESWKKLQGCGYKLRLDAIPFQAAKASSEIISDYKYKEAFEKVKGRMVGLRKLEDDIKIAHSVHAAQLQSDVNYKKDFEKSRTQFRLPMDMVELVHARKAQSLVSDQDYKHMLHQYTSLPDDLKMQWAKKAYELQSEKLYRSDMNFMRGAAWITTGALQIEGEKKASDLISEKKYRQHPCSFKHTTVTDSPDLLHAKFSNMITNERLYKAAGEDVMHHYTLTLGAPELNQARINAANFSDAKYRESWLNLRAQGYKLTMEAIPFQAAKSSREIASDYQYKHNFVKEKGKHIGARSILDDPKLLHCMQVGKLQSEQQYKKEFQQIRSQFHLPFDMMNMVHAKKAQALASDQDYKQRFHEYTMLPDDMKMEWARKINEMQSEKLYKSDVNTMKGLGWMALGSPQIENVKKAGELISEKKYRQHPDTLKFTAVVDSPDLVHARNSYLQCSDRLYRSGNSESMHRYTLPPDHPEFIRARMNAKHISDKMYKTSWEQIRAAGYDLRLDAIPFQTAKASREIASDFRYREAFVKDKGHQIGFRNINDDSKMKHFLAVSKLQSNKEYKKQFEEMRSQYKVHCDQPGFKHAKKSQEQVSDVNYRQRLHQYTCDPEQLNLKHAREAHKLQSDVKYKSDLNWLRGVGWTPPGYQKVEMARRAAELAYAEGLDSQEAAAQYEQMMQGTWERTSRDELQHVNVNPDASEILHVKKKKIQQIKK